MKKTIVIEVIAFLFILLFCYAAFNKTMEFQKFTVQIGQSPLLTGFGSIIPALVILSELVVAVCLIVPRARMFGFYAAFCLMITFTIYIVAILNFSPHIPCSCGGVLDKLTWNQHLVFNMVFVVLAVVAIWLKTESAQERNFLLNG